MIRKLDTIETEFDKGKINKGIDDFELPSEIDKVEEFHEIDSTEQEDLLLSNLKDRI